MPRLGEFITLTKGNSYKGEYLDQEGEYLLGLGTIKQGGGFKLNNLKEYSGPYKEEQLVHPGETYLALTSLTEITRPFLGSPATIPFEFPRRGIITHHVGKVDWKTEDQLWRDYCRWTFHSLQFRFYCMYKCIGTTVFSISPRDVLDYPIEAHISEQKKSVVHVLNSFEKLKSSKIKENHSLQSQIQELYFQTFLRTKHGQSIVKTDDSNLPEGWVEASLHDIAVQRKDTLRIDDIDAETPYVGLTHIPKRNLCMSSWGDASELASNKYQISQGDILFGKLRPYFHKVAIAPTEGVCSTDILVVNAIEDYDYALVLAILFSSRFVEYVSAIVTGVSLPRTSWKDFRFFKFALPPISMRKKFSKQIQPLLERIVLNRGQLNSIDGMMNDCIQMLAENETDSFHDSAEWSE